MGCRYSVKRDDLPSGFNAPLDVTIMIHDLRSWRFQIQPNRARNTICAFGRIGGHVIGFCANNSAVASGQIDIDLPEKRPFHPFLQSLQHSDAVYGRHHRIPPGHEQESRGIVQAGRAMLDSIIDPYCAFPSSAMRLAVCMRV